MDASRVAPSNLFEGDAGVYADALNGCIPLGGFHTMASIERSEVGIPGFLQVLYSTIQI